MTYYAALKSIKDVPQRKRTILGLQRLRAALDSELPPRLNDGRLLLATWNIRELDAGKYGPRLDESYFYIAEIISRFDIVAVQEIKKGLYPLQRLLRLLGNWWSFVVTDVTLGTSGNSERMAFLFDKRKVSFEGLAAELVLPKSKAPDEEILQFARSPYIAGFRTGWAYLTLVTVHIYYGTGVAVDPRRLKEIQDFGSVLAANAGQMSSAPQYEPDSDPVRDNLIILGDFNIFNRKDVTMEALTKAGFRVPDELQAIPGSNVAKDKHYDQIAYFKKLQSLTPTGKAGVFDFFEHVYRKNSVNDDEADYAAHRTEKPGKDFKDWRTFQMSDHLPMWIEFNSDSSAGYLKDLLEN
jgi:hypothetical protein